MTYKIIIENQQIARLNLGEDPYWEGEDGRFPISRYESELPNWGPEATYIVSGPDGLRAEGSCSNHDGCGVSTPNGEWGFQRVDDEVTLLGGETRLTIDREARRVLVETAEPPDMLPYILCGLCILLDGS